MIELKTHNAIDEIGIDKWRSLVNSDYPFLRYEFLEALEKSGSVSSETGWQPLHIELIENGTTIVLMPCYLKHHSYGEYVFDWSWADAYQRNGLNYYPKLLTAIPFTPASGPRWLSSRSDSQTLSLLESAMDQLMAKTQVQSWHLLFPPLSESPTPETQNRRLLRLGIQYHWFNPGYDSFEHFLSEFKARKRKDLNKERRKVTEQGIRFRKLSGSEISDLEIDQFYQFYAATYLKRGRAPYLSLDFFQRIFRTMPEQILLVLAERDGKPIAGALSFRDKATLYGRYWGCLDEYDSLHFETCYYQGIEYCIDQGIKRFDPGAQGEHKIKRGFRPITTHSYHWIASPPFRDAIDRFLQEEREAIHQHLPVLESYLPFKTESE